MTILWTRFIKLQAGRFCCLSELTLSANMGLLWLLTLQFNCYFTIVLRFVFNYDHVAHTVCWFRINWPVSRMESKRKKYKNLPGLLLTCSQSASGSPTYNTSVCQSKSYCKLLGKNTKVKTIILGENWDIKKVRNAETRETLCQLACSNLTFSLYCGGLWMSLLKREYCRHQKGLMEASDASSSSALQRCIINPLTVCKERKPHPNKKKLRLKYIFKYTYVMILPCHSPTW